MVALLVYVVTPAHPRSRGENSWGSRGAFSRCGSSPLTRGKLGLIWPVVQAARLIPAHAGKTPDRLVPALLARAHPRSRGENLQAHYQDDSSGGSSPLTRGKLGLGFLPGDLAGLIPAHAGKTLVCQAARRVLRAHPRSRGENVTISAGWDRLEGSSPLTRGKLRALLPPSDHAGLIPAHAGKTLFFGRQVARIAGSSPLTRGKQDHSSFLVRVAGLIPAHAGKTSPRSRRGRPHRAHPRSRGENWISGAQLRGSEGSSPLTRGKRPTRRC